MSTFSKYRHVRVGVLDIQGSVEEHLAALKKLGVTPVGVKTKEDLDLVDGLIIPGGESTTLGKLLKWYGLDTEIKKRAVGNNKRPLAVWGTCAGAILMAKKVSNRAPDNLALMDIEIKRNAYGRQADSFETTLEVRELGMKKIPALFIRAPQITKTAKDVDSMAYYGGSPVMAQQKNLLVTMFHPELTEDTRTHEYFLSLTQKYAKKR